MHRAVMSGYFSFLKNHHFRERKECVNVYAKGDCSAGSNYAIMCNNNLEFKEPIVIGDRIRISRAVQGDMEMGKNLVEMKVS